MAKKLIMRAPDGSIMRIESHECLESTAALAKHYAKAGYPDRYVIFSERKSVCSATGEKLKAGVTERGVYLSLLLRPSIFISQAGFVRAMAAVALSSALSEHTDRRVGIGWISDIFCEGKLIGGAMTEGLLDSFSAYEYIIVTFEVKLTDADFPPRLTDMVKKVFESENTSISMIIAKNILSKFMTLYPKQLKSPEKFMDIYKHKFAMRGARITYTEGGKRKRCRVLGVDSSNGMLIVELTKGKIAHIANPKSIVRPKKIKLKAT